MASQSYPLQSVPSGLAMLPPRPAPSLASGSQPRPHPNTSSGLPTGSSFRGGILSRQDAQPSRTFWEAINNLYLAIGLAVTLSMTFIGYHLSTLSWRMERWTAYRDFYEICLEIKQAHEKLSEDCTASLERGVPHPPFVKRYLDSWFHVHLGSHRGFSIPESRRARESDPLFLTIVVVVDILCYGGVAFGLYRLLMYIIKAVKLKQNQRPDTSHDLHSARQLSILDEVSGRASGSWGSVRGSSHSLSQETLRPSKPSHNFSISNEDEADVYCSRSGSISTISPYTAEGETDPGMRRTESGMFMPYDENEDEAVVYRTLFGQALSAVLTVKDIAHVFWNVGSDPGKSKKV